MANRKQTPAKKTKQKPQKRSYSLPMLIVLTALSVLVIWLGVAKPGASTMVGTLQAVLRGLAGDMTALLSVVMMYLGIYQVVARRRGTFSGFHVFGVIVLGLGVLTGAELLKCPQLADQMKFFSYYNFAFNAYLAQTGGGILGSLAWFLYKPLDVVGGFIVLLTVMLVDVVLLTHAEISGIIEWFRQKKSIHDERAEKRREEKELNGMFDYDDFEDEPVRPARRPVRRSEPPRTRPDPRTQSAARRPRRETVAEHPLYDMEENAELQRVRSERRARRANADADADMLNMRETSPRPTRAGAGYMSEETDDIAPIRSRRAAAAETENTFVAEDAAEMPRARRTTVRETSPRPGRTAAEPVRVPRVTPIEDDIPDMAEEQPAEPPKRYYDDEAKSPAFRPVRRGASAHPDEGGAQENPFNVIRYKTKVDTPISGDDFAGGHTRTVHGQSALKGGKVTGTIDTRPRAGMGMPPVDFGDADEEEIVSGADVPIEERDLTIEPVVYEEPDDDEPPFDIPDAPQKQLGKFTRRQKVEVAEEAYNYPPLDLLAPGNAAMQEDTRDQDLDRAQQLEDTLHALGIDAKLTGIAHGPAVTRFEFEVPLKMLTKVNGCEIAIAYQMAAKAVRIEAPIPGKKAVGIEIPNESVETVLLRDVLESPEARKQGSRIAVALGKDNAGRYIMADIAKMPHVLIAGSTGSGKSVCENAIIMSILYRASPEEVKLIMIDPKQVELTGYNEIPHLIAPVVTDAEKAAAALDWATVEMDRRYKLFKDNGVKDIVGYNKRLPEGEKPLPQIVIIIDELADLMMTAAREVEASICRITQLARAAGMHLVVATQRPSTDVVTGLIKNNMPARIGFKVSSQVDSRTIFDVGGAEKLLGRGDMIYLLSNGEKMRIQGTWVSPEEVERVVGYIKDRHGNCYDEDVIEHMNRSSVSDAERDDAMDEECDDRLEEAVEIVIDAGQASISMLQRKMRVGYARAGRLIDEMCRRGIVSEADGSKPRVVLITKEQFYSAFSD